MLKFSFKNSLGNEIFSFKNRFFFLQKKVVLKTILKKIKTFLFASCLSLECINDFQKWQITQKAKWIEIRLNKIDLKKK